MPYYNLDKILNLEKWQDLQNSLADATQLAIITIDYKGKPISTHSKCTPFCQRIRNNPDLSKMCQKCDSRAGLEAVRYNKPYIYLCHYNIIDIAIPITSDDKYIGAIMAGQVKPSFSGTVPDLEQIYYSPASLQALQESPELKRLYRELPSLNYNVISRTSDMLFKLCNYIVEEATAKNIIVTMYNSTQPNASALNSMPLAKSTHSNTPIPVHTVNVPFAKPKNTKLLPALEYIYNNAHLMVSLEKAAQLCHLSPGYFSRSFTKEFGTNYTAYTIRLKIEWAKELLSSTDLSVTQISDQLGFSDPGYFTKVFKKQEYLTPSLYRKYTPPEYNVTY
ncbi:MAG: PocR ligand-binding domain-containing protein [Lachnospiraceae bacterium]